MTTIHSALARVIEETAELQPTDSIGTEIANPEDIATAILSMDEIRGLVEALKGYHRAAQKQDWPNKYTTEYKAAVEALLPFEPKSEV